jgi:hypothetical protein
MGIGKSLFRVASELGGTGKRFSKEATMLRTAPTTGSQNLNDVIADVVGKTPPVTPTPKRVRRTAEDAAMAKQAQADLIEQGKRERKFKSLLRQHRDATSKFDSTYVAAKNRGSISDNKIDVLYRGLGNIKDIEAELKQFYDEGFDGDYPDWFTPHQDFSHPKHYEPIDMEKMVRDEQLKNASTTPPEGVPLGGTSFGNNKQNGFRPNKDNLRNSEDPDMEVDLDYAQLEKERLLQQELHNVISGATMNPTTVTNAMNNGGAVASWIAQRMAFTDLYAKIIGNRSEAGRVMSDAARGINSSAMHYKGVMKSEAGRLLSPVRRLYDTTVDASVWSSMKRHRDTLLKQKSLDEGLTERLLINAQEYANHLPITKTGNADVQRLVDAYKDSNVNQYVLDKLQASGVGLDIKQNPYKIPIKFSYDKAEGLLLDAKLSKEELYRFMGEQITKGNLAFLSLDTPLNAKQVRAVGRAFYKKLEDSSRNGGQANYKPIAVKLEDKELSKLINENLNGLFERAGEFTEEFYWDFKSNFTTSNGSTVKLAEFLDAKVLDNVEGYVERSSGSYGLAYSGLLVRAVKEDLTKETLESIAKNEVTLEEVLKDLYVPVNNETRFGRFHDDKLELIRGDRNRGEAAKILENAQHMVFGRAAGDAIPPAMQASQTLASSTLLVMSGVFNISDWGTMKTDWGALQTLGTLVAALPSGKFWRFIGNNLTKEEAEESLGILTTTQRANEARIKSYSSFIDNPAYADNRIYSTIGWLGQYTPHYNGSTLVQRMQLYTMSQILDREMGLLGKGKKGNKSLRAKLKRSGATDEMIDKWAEAINTFGTDTRKWSAEYLPNRFDTEMNGLLDKTVLKVTGGELPDILQNSSVGKAILPFMSAQLSLTNSLLRNKYNQGAVPILELIAYQTPFALAAVYLKEIINGRNPEDLTAKQLIFSYLSALPTIGGGGLLLSLINQGDGGRGLSATSTAFTYVNNVAAFEEKLLSGEATTVDLLKIMPLAGVNPVVKGMLSTAHKPD